MDINDPDLATLRVAWRSLSNHFDALSAGDLSPISEYWHPELVIEHVDGWPVPGTYTGYAGFRQWFSEAFGGDYAGYETRGYEAERIGDDVFVLVDTAWTGRDGEEVVPQVTLNFQLRGGRIAHMDVFIDEDRALAAARV